MGLETPVEEIPGIGKFYSFKLKKLGIQTQEDFFYHFPARYDDYSSYSQISNIKIGQVTTVHASVKSIKNVRTKSGKFITVATVADETGTIEIVWFNQPYLTKNIKPAAVISLSGKTQLDGYKVKMLSPSYEIIKPRTNFREPITENLNTTLHTARLVPVYPETEGISSKWLRVKIASMLKNHLNKLHEFLPPNTIKDNNLLSLQEAISKIHFPQNFTDVNNAKERLSFDELFVISLLSQIRKKDWSQNKTAPKMKINRNALNKFTQSLPFKLTASQEKATKEILQDLTSQVPANRLLEGDVGSGKTVVAAAACYIASQNGYSTIIAAPTEILAFQHQKTLTQLLSRFNISVGIWTKSKKEKGEVTCGTHALLNKFPSSIPVGLVVVDEQHRFGVAQRAKMFKKHSKETVPHFLTMTATPIPRTLALTLYGDLNLSVLDEMPKGRKRIATYLVPARKRNDAYRFIEKKIEENEQVFIVTPFVEDSETLVGVKSAKSEFERLSFIFSSKVKLSLLHGRLKSKEKEKIIEGFKIGKTDILVTTPVVEVGIDVPNASIIVIESAERFGLAQLHQLRGRVGRGSKKSYCLLFSDTQLELTKKRLKSMEKIQLGFQLAEIDLKLRGPGEVFGYQQSGYSALKIANIFDSSLVKKTQSAAKKLLKYDPDLIKNTALKLKVKKLNLDSVEPN